MGTALLKFKKKTVPTKDERTDRRKLVERVRKENFYDKKTGRICGMTPLQYRAAEAFLRVNNRRLAVKMASNNKNITKGSQETLARRIFNDDVTLAYLERRLAEKGKFKTALDRICDAMDATQIHKGEDTYEPDHKVRLQAAKMVLDLAGVLDARKHSEASQEILDYEKLRELPFPVLEWIHKHGRMPTKTEEKEILDSIIDAKAEEAK